MSSSAASSPTRTTSSMPSWGAWSAARAPRRGLRRVRGGDGARGAGGDRSTLASRPRALRGREVVPRQTCWPGVPALRSRPGVRWGGASCSPEIGRRYGTGRPRRRCIWCCRCCAEGSGGGGGGGLPRGGAAAGRGYRGVGLPRGRASARPKYRKAEVPQGRSSAGSLFGGSVSAWVLQALSRGRLRGLSTAGTTPSSHTTSRPTESPYGRSPRLVAPTLDDASGVRKRHESRPASGVALARPRTS